MRARGFTLIELLAAMAILAVVSVMAVQMLGGALRQQAVLERIDTGAAPLIRTLALLRQDLEATLPPPAGTPDLTAGMLLEPDALTLWRGGLADLPGAPSAGVGRVRWAVQDGALTRALDDAAPRPMLAGVSALALSPLAVPEGADPAVPAPGYALTLETAGQGALRLVVAR